MRYPIDPGASAPSGKRCRNTTAAAESAGYPPMHHR